MSKVVEKVSSWLSSKGYANITLRLGQDSNIPIPLPYTDPLQIDGELPVVFAPARPESLVVDEEARYIDVAERVADDIEPITRILFHAKKSGRRVKDHTFNAPFVAILSPSGTGKTQLGYALASQHGKYLSTNENLDILTIHFVMSKFTQFSQRINLAVKSASENFLKLCAADFFSLKKHYSKTKDPEAVKQKLRSTQAFRDAQDEPLFAVGFLDTLLEDRKRARDSKERFEFRPCETGKISVSQFRAKWTETEEGIGVRENQVVKLICIILDEFHLAPEDQTEPSSFIDPKSRINVITEPNLRSVQLFARNLCRSLGVVCCVMGTDSAATNLLVKESLGSDESSNDKILGEYTPWVYVINRLPSAKIENIPGYKQLVDSGLEDNPVWRNVVQWLKKSDDPPSPNPRLLSYFLEELVAWYTNAGNQATPEEIFNAIIPGISDQLVHIKRSLLSKRSALGQCAMYFSRWTSEELLPSYLVHTFFAYLCTPNNTADYFNEEATQDLNEWCFVLYKRGLKLVMDPEPPKPEKWKPQSMLKKDELLLLLMSWNSETKYSLDFKVRSVYYLYLNMYVSKISKLSTKENPNTLHNHEGHYLEHLSYLALIKASHQGGFGGTRLDMAIPMIISSLSKCKKPSRTLLKADCGFNELADKLRSQDCIPFLGTIETKLTGLKSAFPEGKFGILLQTPDSTKVDGIARPLENADCRTVIIEAKNTEEPKHGGVVSAIIKKALEQTEGKPAFIMIASLNFTNIHPNTLKKHFQTTEDIFIFHTELEKDNQDDDQVDLKLIYPDMEKAKSKETFPTNVVVLFHLSRIFGAKYSVDHPDHRVKRKLGSQKRTANDR